MRSSQAKLIDYCHSPVYWYEDDW